MTCVDYALMRNRDTNELPGYAREALENAQEKLRTLAASETELDRLAAQSEKVKADIFSRFDGVVTAMRAAEQRAILAESCEKMTRALAEKEYSKLSAQVETLKAERDKLAAFKAFVHRRLDEMEVPTHPDGKHSKAGCRIGDRLDIVQAERTKPQARQTELLDLLDLKKFFQRFTER